MDEAGIRVRGKNYWLWTFRTPDDDVVVVIRSSRGQNVLREIFGGDINGAGVADGWRAYNLIPEHVLMRKIIGTFRSEDDAEYYQYIASVFTSWRLQGKDDYNELKKLLINELCLK